MNETYEMDQNYLRYLAMGANGTIAAHVVFWYIPAYSTAALSKQAWYAQFGMLLSAAL